MGSNANQGTSSLRSMCGILETMLQIETTSIGLDNERKLTGAINRTSCSLSGMCGILEAILQIETTPIGLDNERKLTDAINRVEILRCTGKIPAQYAQAADNHMFSVMDIKF